MRILLVILLALLCVPMFCDEQEYVTVSKNLINYGNVLSLKVNDLIATETSEIPIKSENSWIKYSLSKSKLAYYLTSANIFQFSWKEISKEKSRITSYSFKYEIYFYSLSDNREHYILCSSVEGLEKQLEYYYKEKYYYHNGLYIPEACKNYYKILLTPQHQLLNDLFKLSKELRFYSFIIEPGIFSSPGSREEPKLDFEKKLPPEMIKNIKEKYHIEYPIKGLWYDTYLSGIIKQDGLFKWGFILQYHDLGLQKDDFSYLRDHLRNWVSLRNMDAGFSSYIDLKIENIKELPLLTYSTFHFWDNIPNDFWFREILNRSKYF